METKLTAQDLDLLLEALDTWEKESSASGLLGSVLGIVFSDESERDETLADTKRIMMDADRERRQRARRAILVKAKLVMMQDEAAADQLFKRVKVGEGKDG